MTACLFVCMCVGEREEGGRSFTEQERRGATGSCAPFAFPLPAPPPPCQGAAPPLRALWCPPPPTSPSACCLRACLSLPLFCLSGSLTVAPLPAAVSGHAPPAAYAPLLSSPPPPPPLCHLPHWRHVAYPLRLPPPLRPSLPELMELHGVLSCVCVRASFVCLCVCC